MDIEEDIINEKFILLEEGKLIGDNKKDEKINELLKDINSLKTLILDINSYVHVQGEEINKLTENLNSVKSKTDSVAIDISEINTREYYKINFGYITEYIIPFIGSIGVNYPVFWALGPKIGILSSVSSFIFWKLK